MPSGISLHVPLFASTPHDLQVPVHALSQQTPSAQNPLLHSMPSLHIVPLHFAMQYVPPQSTPPSSPFCTLSLHEMHFSWSQLGFVPVLQSLLTKHSTQMAMLLHTPPLQLAPGCALVVIGVPLLQPSMVHMLPSNGGVSVSSLTCMVLPMPSQASVLQSPFVGSLIFMPAGANATVQTFIIEQDQLAHGVSAGQSPGFMHMIPPLELLDDEDELDDDDDDDDDAPPPAPAVPLDELELLLSPALPPVALLGSN